jgi:hypothetical protein
MTCWALSVLLLSFPNVRGFLAHPLYVRDENLSSESAYVMADGFAYWGDHLD